VGTWNFEFTQIEGATVAFFRIEHSTRQGNRGAHAALALLSTLAALLTAAAEPAHAQQKAEAAKRPPLGIAIFTSARTDLCYDPGDTAAITTLAKREQDRINRLGGVAGRSIQLRFLDDARNDQTAITNLRSALGDPQTVAMIGMSNSNRAKVTFEALAPDLRESNIPFISNISVNSIFAPYPNVFTTQASQDDERLPVMTQFMRHMVFKRPAFVGLSDGVTSMAIGDGLKRQLGDIALVADYRLKVAGDGLDRSAVTAMIADLKAKQADIAVLGIGTGRVAALLPDLVASGITPALFITGRIDALPPAIANAYPNAIYQLAWDRLPEADNDRLRKLIAKSAPDSWLFEGRKVADAPGWKTGECKARPETETPDPLNSANLRAIGIGTQFADMVAMIAAAAKTAEPGVDMASLRRHVAQQLTTAYAAGKGAFKGSFENWSFQSKSRSAVRTPFVVMLPQGLNRTQLAPIQFIKVKDGSLRQIETLYVDIDLIRAHRVDDNDKTFFAEFYLAMRDSGTASIDQIEFTNAYLDPKTNGRQITVETLHGGGKSDAYPDGMKMYKIAGRFTFEPDLAGYPFDTQRFSIDLQPKRGDKPFIIQPPPPQLRDTAVVTDGWEPKSQYVGYDEDFVPMVDAFTHAPSIVPFYKASFVWIMKRTTTDYFFRVVVPLMFIFIVAYLSIFIPYSHFEAVVTIQVTALLSAVALYLSLPKLDSDAATMSDRIFVFNYMVVSLMIVLSILRVNRFVAAVPGVKAGLGVLHVTLIPVLVAAMAWYVYGLSLGDR
jgi:ABC-type branched-subunit amino acid transport system substrate-binding protein